MAKTPSTATLIGKALGALIQNGITFWAAVSTSGLVHGVLIGYLVFNAVVFIAYGAINVAKSEAKSASATVDFDKLAAAMRRTRSLDGTRR